MSAGKGRTERLGWTKNSKGSWVITTTHGTAKPETLFFVDPEFTTVKNARGLIFQKRSADSGEKIEVSTGKDEDEEIDRCFGSALRSVNKKRREVSLYSPQFEVTVISENAATGDGIRGIVFCIRI